MENAHEYSKYEYLLEKNKNYMNYTAFTFGKRKITFEEFHQRTNEFAQALYKKGIRKGDKVAVILENTPESAYLVYALSIIGAVDFGFSIFNNPYKMKRDFEFAKPKVVISTDIVQQLIKNPCDALNISPILYSPRESHLEVDDEHNLDKIVSDFQNSGIVYDQYDPNVTSDVLFTGGSSGTHKGVELNGGGINSVIESCKDVFHLEPGQIHLGNIPFGHMIFGRFVLHYALANNLEYALTLNGLPNDFLAEIIAKKANGAIGGPPHWNNLQNNPLLKPGCISFLEQGATGGEAYKSGDERKNRECLRYGGSYVDVINMLGLTEMTGLTHACVPGKNTLGTIGDPISNVRDMIASPSLVEKAQEGISVHFEELPKGETGVLLTDGAGKLLGYYQNPEETRKVLLRDTDGTVWYNTGDLAYRTGNTLKEAKFNGRLKRNFVCGCENIYPEQIEELVSELAEVREVIVTEVPDEKYQFLPFYHIRLLSEQCDPKEVQNKIEVLIESTLGPSALPGYIDFTTEPLSLTDNGKGAWSELKKNDIVQYEKGELALVRKNY